MAKCVQLWLNEQITLDIPPSDQHRKVSLLFRKAKSARTITVCIEAERAIEITHIKTFPENFSSPASSPLPSPNIES